MVRQSYRMFNLTRFSTFVRFLNVFYYANLPIHTPITHGGYFLVGYALVGHTKQKN